MAVIINQIQKSFGKKKVLTGIDYTLKDGGIYCLMGPSGMGKTTLLRILMGLERPDSGAVEGVKENEIAVMFQEDRLFPQLSAVENVAMVYRKKPFAKDIAENLKLILPENCLNQPVSQLSGGMKRRVALARAMHFPAKLIILDEPFTGLDRETRQEVIDYILKMRNGRILLVATHGVDDAVLLGAEVIRLDELQAGDGSPDPEEKPKREISLSRGEIFSNMKMFQGIPEKRYEEIIKTLGGYETDYLAGETVWRQFDRHSSMGIILKGSIQAEDISGRETQIIQQFQAGQSFGEAVAFGSHSSWVEIRAVVKSRVLFLPAANFLNQVGDEDIARMLANLLEEISGKLAILNFKNQILAEPRLRNRVLMYLATLPADEEGFKTVPFTQKALARYLNVNYSAFCRELSRMREEKIIESRKSQVRVLIKNAGDFD